MKSVTKNSKLIYSFIIFLTAITVSNTIASEAISKPETLTTPKNQNETTPINTSQSSPKEEKNIPERVYSFNISSGLTTFSGNRGDAYEDKGPSLGLSFLYYFNKKMAIGIGTAYSKHYMLVNSPTRGFSQGAGLIEVSMLESFVLYRYYVNFDSTATNKFIQYTNPYLTTRAEFWNQTNKYVDLTNSPNDTHNSLGVALGGGFEFPIKVARSYIGIEALYHFVNFQDTYTQLYRPVDGSSEGYNDLTGNVMTLFASYVVGW
ncbi:MAG: hypothetical protein HQK51_09360 [Oligoflexia bacterium]|nr:hypothetical protein [Oligoflexia bacterium]